MNVELLFYKTEMNEIVSRLRDRLTDMFLIVDGSGGYDLVLLHDVDGVNDCIKLAIYHAVRLANMNNLRADEGPKPSAYYELELELYDLMKSMVSNDDLEATAIFLYKEAANLAKLIAAETVRHGLYGEVWIKVIGQYIPVQYFMAVDIDISDSWVKLTLDVDRSLEDSERVLLDAIGSIDDFALAFENGVTTLTTGKRHGWVQS